jgi:hypothetical protein
VVRGLLPVVTYIEVKSANRRENIRVTLIKATRLKQRKGTIDSAKEHSIQKKITKKIMLDLVRNRVYIVYKARLKVLDGCCDGWSAVAPVLKPGHRSRSIE